jgi:hypothetical protein
MRVFVAGASGTIGMVRSQMIDRWPKADRHLHVAGERRTCRAFGAPPIGLDLLERHAQRNAVLEGAPRRDRPSRDRSVGGAVLHALGACAPTFSTSWCPHLLWVGRWGIGTPGTERRRSR